MTTPPSHAGTAPADNAEDEWEPVRPHLSAFDPDSFVRPVERFGWRPVPAPAGPHRAGPRPLDGLRLLVLGEDAQLVEGVTRSLERRGGRVARSDPTTPWSDAADPGNAVDPACGRSAAWDGIIDLNVTGLSYQLGDPTWRNALRRTTESIQRVYRTWAEESHTHRYGYLVVTNLGGLMGYHDTGSRARIPQPLGGIWAGMAKSLPREMPTVDAVVVDLDCTDPEAIATAVECEYGRGEHFEVSYRDGVRYVLAGKPAERGPGQLTFGPDDVVLVTGGARGVGFAVTSAIAREFGCRVIVTGRGEQPGPSPVNLLDDAGFAAWRKERISGARDPATLTERMREVRRADSARSIYRNFTAVTAAGLRMEYQQCECTKLEDLERVFSTLEQPPTVILHNAGIDHPVRFIRKTPEEVIGTVEVKITGFANLVAAVLARPERRERLRLLCNVGSLAGRMGGMIGQLDYSAANEGLARFGFWARDEGGLPVQTLCWPTWERMGVITNYSAAVRYSSTLDPEDGVRRWLEELRGGYTNEVVFLGRVGSVMMPTQLFGYQAISGHPDLPRLRGLLHHLGDLEEYRLFRRLRSSMVLWADSDPCMSELTVQGAPAVPVSVVLEHAVAAGDWIVPEGWPAIHLTELRDLEVDLLALRFADGRLALTRVAEGREKDHEWQVSVRLSRSDGGLVLAVTMVYAELPPAITVPPGTVRTGGQAVEVNRDGPLRWAGSLFPAPQAVAGDRTGRDLLPTQTTPDDLWASPFPPAATIAPGAVEALVWAATTNSTMDVPGILRVDRWTLRPGAQRVDRLAHVDVGGTGWLGLRAGVPVMLAEGVRALGEDTRHTRSTPPTDTRGP